MFTQIIWTVVCTQNIVFQHPGLSMMWYLESTANFVLQCTVSENLKAWNSKCIFVILCRDVSRMEIIGVRKCGKGGDTEKDKLFQNYCDPSKENGLEK